VRYIRSLSDNTNNPAWDQHSNLPARTTPRVDKPVAGLLKDQGADCRAPSCGGAASLADALRQHGHDHNDGLPVLMAGGGIKRGISYGETDEFGHFAIENKVHMHDLHATILHQLGLDHEKLLRHDGRDFRLTDVHRHVVKHST
jgi:hypothetical protein